MYICMYVYMYVCVYICMYVYVYMYVYVSSMYVDARMVILFDVCIYVGVCMY